MSSFICNEFTLSSASVNSLSDFSTTAELAFAVLTACLALPSAASLLAASVCCQSYLKLLLYSLLLA